MLECMYLEMYEASRKYIQKMREHTFSRLEADAKGEALFEKSSISKKQADELRYFRRLYINSCQIALRRCDFWEHLLDSRQCEYIRSIIASRIQRADRSCRRRWKEFYR